MPAWLYGWSLFVGGFVVGWWLASWAGHGTTRKP